MRYLAAELGPAGVRVVGIHTAGVADTFTPRESPRSTPRWRAWTAQVVRASRGDDAAARPRARPDRRDGRVPGLRPRGRDHRDDRQRDVRAGRGVMDVSAATGRHRRELHVHCYRMLASFDEAEDLVQETFLRAWSRREDFDGREHFRAWLYRIATNACLDALRKRARHRSERGRSPTSRGCSRIRTRCSTRRPTTS